MPTLRLAPADAGDYARLAERRLPRALFDYIDGAAGDEATLAANRADFTTMRLKQRVMHDVSDLDPSITLFGEKISMPLALAPIGLAGMMARRAEAQAKKAADAAGVPFCLSTVGICPMEEVAAVSDRPFWFQLYMLRDRGPVRELLERARGLGVRTLVFTVDMAVVGVRRRDLRNGLSGSPGSWAQLRSGLLSYLLHPDWAVDVGVKGKPHTFGNIAPYVPKASTPADFKNWLDSQLDPSVTWRDIEWLREIWPGDLVIKGVLSPEDAICAADAGADAVVVSNHGGRQLDGVSSTISMLPRVVDAVGHRADVLMDGGVRGGQDIVKARAAGAKAALIGRPWVYALAARGRAGLEALLNGFGEDLRVAMALTGARRAEDLTGDVLDGGAQGNPVLAKPATRTEANGRDEDASRPSASSA